MATLTQRWRKQPGGNDDDSDDQEEEDVQQPDDNQAPALGVGGSDDDAEGVEGDELMQQQYNASSNESNVNDSNAGEESDEFELDREILLGLSQLYAENEQEDDGVPDGDATSTSTCSVEGGARSSRRHRDLFTQQGLDESEEEDEEEDGGSQSNSWCTNRLRLLPPAMVQSKEGSTKICKFRRRRSSARVRRIMTRRYTLKFVVIVHP